MPRGGFREGAGGKPTWNHGKTKVIRVPEALAERLLQVARDLDSGNSLTDVTDSMYDSVTRSKVIDLTGISIRAFRDGPGIYLADLLGAGYQIFPERIAQSIKFKKSLAKQERTESLRDEIGGVIEQLKLLEAEKQDL